MGNTVAGGSKKAKVMKINGETIKLKTPARASDVIKDYPDYVLLDSNRFKQFGLRAKPLDLREELKPGKMYFLIQLPKFPEEKVIRRITSGVQTGAKERLESLMLSRRSASDLSLMRPMSHASDSPEPSLGCVQVKMRLPKAKIDKVIEESKDKVEMAEKIIDLYRRSHGQVDLLAQEEDMDSTLLHQDIIRLWNTGVGGNGIKIK